MKDYLYFLPKNSTIQEIKKRKIAFKKNVFKKKKNKNNAAKRQIRKRKENGRKNTKKVSYLRQRK